MDNAMAPCAVARNTCATFKCGNRIGKTDHQISFVSDWMITFLSTWQVEPQPIMWTCPSGLGKQDCLDLKSTNSQHSKKRRSQYSNTRNHWWLTIHNQLYIAVNLPTMNHLPKRSIWYFGTVNFSSSQMRESHSQFRVILHVCMLNSITETDFSATVAVQICPCQSLRPCVPALRGFFGNRR